MKSNYTIKIDDKLYKSGLTKTQAIALAKGLRAKGHFATIWRKK